MRTHLFRGALALAALLFLSSSASAQSVVRGKVNDAQGKPIEGATVMFEAEGVNRQDADQDRQERRLPAGRSVVGRLQGHRVERGRRRADVDRQRSPGSEQPDELQPSAPPAACRAADKEAAVATQAAAGAALEAMKAGNHAEAIVKFNEVIAKVPNCAECYYNIGVAQTRLSKPAEAEAAFKKAIELKPDSADAYTGLANLYNAQKKFDLAAEASAKASKFSAARRAAAAPRPATTRA